MDDLFITSCNNHKYNLLLLSKCHICSAVINFCFLINLSHNHAIHKGKVAILMTMGECHQNYSCWTSFSVRYLQHIVICIKFSSIWWPVHRTGQLQPTRNWNEQIKWPVKDNRTAVVLAAIATNPHDSHSHKCILF